MITMTDIAKEIKNIRTRTGLSQQKFSELTGIPVRTLENWESGARSCPGYTVRLLEYYVEHELIK